MQLGLKVNDKKQIGPIVDKMKQAVLALHSRIEGDKLITEKRSYVPIYDIPNFKNLNKACKFMSKHHQVPYDYALGSIGINDEMIVLNANHLAADGKFTSILFDYLKGDIDLPIPDRIRDCDSVFEKEIREAKEPLPPFMSNDASLCRILVKDEDKLLRSNSQAMHHFSNKTDAKDLQVYDKATGSVHGLSDSFWTNIILSISANNNDFSKKALANCCDMRPFMKSYDFGITNAFADLALKANNISKDSTVKEMMDSIRKDFKQRYASNQLFGYLRTMQINTTPANFEGIAPELSNIGRFILKPPFTDVWVNCTMSDKLIPKNIPILSYSIEDENRNEMHTIMRFNTASISKQEVSRISKMIHFGMEKIPLSTPCGKAIDILQEYQRKLRNEEKKVYH